MAARAVWVLGMWLDPSDAGISDLPLYEHFGRAVADGQVPYRDFALEYPPLAALLFWLPTLAPGLSYEDAFGLEMLACAWVVQAAGARLGGSAVAWGMVAVPPLFGTLARERFDLAPAAAVLVALLALTQGRSRAGFAWLGVGASLKLFPLLLAPVALAWLLARGRAREAWAGVAVCAAVIAVVCVPFAALDADGFADQFRFHAERPVQIESTPASVLRALGGSEVTNPTGHEDRFRSQGLAGGSAGLVELVFTLLCFAAYAAAVARGRRDLLAGSLAALLALVALGKVLSPQYLLFLLPLALIAWPSRASRLTIAAALLTAAYFPQHYAALVAGEDHAVVAVAARNLLLVGAFAAVLSVRGASAKAR